jgi:hypothetical protein
MVAGAPTTPSLRKDSTLDAHLGDTRIPLAIGDPGEGMEHLWSPAGATGGNRRLTGATTSTPWVFEALGWPSR